MDNGVTIGYLDDEGQSYDKARIRFVSTHGILHVERLWCLGGGFERQGLDSGFCLSRSTIP